MKILIVEDEMLIAEDISEMLEEMGHEVIGIADNWKQAMHLAKEKTPNLALLDIRIKGEKDGINVGVDLKEQLNIKSIFLTSHSDKGIVKRAIEANPLSYLVKPIKEEELFIAMQVAAKRLELDDNEQFVYVRIGSVNHKFKLNEISHLESDGNYTHLFVKGEKYTTSLNMKTWLNDDNFKKFIRVHRSYAVNPHFLKEFTNKGASINGFQIPIGRKYKENLEGLKE